MRIPHKQHVHNTPRCGPDRVGSGVTFVTWVTRADVIGNSRQRCGKRPQAKHTRLTKGNVALRTCTLSKFIHVFQGAPRIVYGRIATGRPWGPVGLVTNHHNPLTPDRLILVVSSPFAAHI